MLKGFPIPENENTPLGPLAISRRIQELMSEIRSLHSDLKKMRDEAKNVEDNILVKNGALIEMTNWLKIAEGQSKLGLVVNRLEKALGDIIDPVATEKEGVENGKSETV